MKKILTAVFALTLVTSIAAPAFAWTADTCPFTDKALCVTESLSSQTDDA